MQLGQLIAGLPLAPVGASPPAVIVRDITEDSRTASPGCLFIARGGTKVDGRTYISAAINAGAAAVLTDDPSLAAQSAGSPGAAPVVFLHAADVPLAAALVAERFFGNPTDHLSLVGVTGTKGKTTTSWLIHQLLNRHGARCGLIGTVCIDDGTRVVPATLTTPPAIELSRTFAQMRAAGCTGAAMEVSSHALHQRRAAGLRFRVGVFTNLEHDHLDYHGTMEQYAAAKAMLFEALPPQGAGGPGGAGGLAIINSKDPFARRMIRDTRARVLGCSVVTPADARTPLRRPTHMAAECVATIRGEDARGSDVTFSGPWGEGGRTTSWDVRLPLIGAHNVMNALQASAAAFHMGLSAELIKAGLAVMAAPPGRMEPVTTPADPFAVYVDYAHTEDSLRKVLALARSLATGRVIAVFGCGGDRDRTKRPRMGAAAAELAHVAFLTSDNPRTEDPGAIIDEVLAGIPAASRSRVQVEPDRERAIHLAIKAARDGDIVIIAGKGHEDYQILADGKGGTIKRHFDDREVARAALLARGIGVPVRAAAAAAQEAPRR